MTHSITENLDDITTEQQRLLTAIGIENIEDIAAPKSRKWSPISYSREKLQFTRDIKRPAILLVALSDVKEDNFLLHGLPGKLILAHDPAYMDDLITPSATLELLQKKADIISAFCIIFGVDIAIKKLRSYVAN